MADNVPAQAPLVLSFDSDAVQLMMPHRRQMALLDRVESYSVHERKIVGIKSVGQNEPALEGHFPDDPLFPGPLIIEALAQASGIMMNIEHALQHKLQLDRLSDPAYIASAPPPPHTVLAESKIRLRRWVRPGEVIRLESHMALRRSEICYFKVRAAVGTDEVAAGEIILALPDYAPEVTREAM
jgi:3-hydroxymyristoyl/3-hydroxydecanoyl-(acyl carrier protein) dehydratase